MLATAWNFPFERPGSIRMPKRSDSFSTPPMWKHGGDWKGHRVAINGQEIGAAQGSVRHLRSCRSLHDQSADSDLEKILSGKDNLVLSVELERQPTQPGLSDDFVLTRIETDGTLALRVEVIQPGCSQSDSRHDAAAEVRRVPPTQNCAKISGCIGSRIPMGGKGSKTNTIGGKHA